MDHRERTPVTNDSLELTPRTETHGPVLELDFPGLAIGVAEYSEGPTGCTVFHFAESAATVADVRGGSPATIGGYAWNDAICFAGGSAYGLEAAAGVAAELFARGGYDTAFDRIALVSGAIVYDFHGRNAIYPDAALGRAALRAAREGAFPLGARGAGSSVTVGKWRGAPGAERAGQGGAFRQVGPTKLAVFTVVNAVGALVDRAGRVVRGNRDPDTDERSPISGLIGRSLEPEGAPSTPAQGNTTVTLVVTNQRLDGRELRQLANQVHASMARAIQPFHTLYDGDVLYAVTTAEVENPALETVALGTLASELAWDAVLSCYAGVPS